MNNLIEKINDFLFLQEGLVKSLLDMYPECKDFKFVLDFPKNGVVEFNGEKWKFFKHGAGFLFRSCKGVEVDVHRDIKEVNFFDLNRIEQYLESKGIGSEGLENEIDKNIRLGNIDIEIGEYKVLKLINNLRLLS